MPSARACPGARRGASRGDAGDLSPAITSQRDDDGLLTAAGSSSRAEVVAEGSLLVALAADYTSELIYID